MRSIKPLPKTIHSSVRSGIILFDLTRVVEELVYNSLDAGATKISVVVGVGTGFVKVVDNGCGISRDGLVLLGERHTTSKNDQFAEMDAPSGSFGFRGEALASISDISLLEVVTKSHGRPNGYRKVMKGCKCLYLGIDDGRVDVGTTVVARDLFYNQPVRRKHMQTSPQKVLHAIKKCVLRIALVHSKVSFKVADCEREVELLCTYPSSSPLQLLVNGFGIEASSSLHELNVSEDMLKLSGYISCPCDASSVKAVQHVYINSRFICKGPIHRMLNRLAAGFVGLDLWKENFQLQSGNQVRSQTCPTYILNLSCPRAFYDLNFEPSKTSVEFKDLNLILTFIGQTIIHFWSENIPSGDSLSHRDHASRKNAMWKEVSDIEVANQDCPKNHGIEKKKGRSQIRQALGSSPSQSKMLTEEHDHIPALQEKRSCQKFHGDAFEFKEHQTEVGFQADSSFQSYEGFVSQDRAMVKQSSSFHLWTPERKVLSTDDIFMGHKFLDKGKPKRQMDHILDSKWEVDASPTADTDMSRKLEEGLLPANWVETGDNMKMVRQDFEKPVLQICSHRIQPHGDEGFEFRSDGFRTKRKRRDHDERIGEGEVDNSNQVIESMTVWQDNTAHDWSSPKLTTRFDTHVDSMEFFPPDSDSSHLSFIPECSPMTSAPLIRTEFSEFWNESLTDDDYDLSHLKYNRSDTHDYLVDGVEDCNFRFGNMRNNSTTESCSLSSCRNRYSGFGEDGYDFQQNNLDDDFVLKCSDPFTDEWDKDAKYFWPSPSHHIPQPSYFDKDERQKIQRRYQEKGYDCERTRSHSAPPFYRGKKRFFPPSNCSTTTYRTTQSHKGHDCLNSRGTSVLKHPQPSPDTPNVPLKLPCLDNSMFSNSSRPHVEKTPDAIEIDNGEMQEEDRLDIFNVDSVEEFTPRETQDSLDYGVKWRNIPPQNTNGEKLHNQETILDISSGILHLADDYLIPKYITKKCLQDAKVLLQVDRKFIPIVGGGTLAIIDQHAADERIRLEELRQKVLSGEMKKISHLDAEQELVLPEIGHQLLHNYSKQVLNWGWICNIHAQGSKSFEKNFDLLQKRPTAVTLLGVPCILGVNLTDVDLLEYLQQLADTDGSSTIPPSVLRVLNVKACRGAIMFGDKLFPSECSLIVKELKQTSLCFQCAHGRPTTIPLVNLEVLRNQIKKLGFSGSGSDEPWHGLVRHEISLERAARRLASGS